jgi:hypothetical protein
MSGLDYGIDVPAKIVRLVFSGSVSHEDWLGTLETIFASPGYRPGFDFLVDRRNAEAPTADEARRMVAFIYRNRAACIDSRWAIVVTSDADFGMVRMTQALAADHPTEIEVFRDMDRAISWLADSER